MDFIRIVTMEEQWVKCSDRLPENDVQVRTKIEDSGGVRNIQTLFRRKGMWFSGEMYVYYTPTHWMPLPEPPKE